MCCDKSAPNPSIALSGQVIDQLQGNTFTVDVSGFGSVVATARAGNIRPLMQVTVIQVGAEWRVL